MEETLEKRRMTFEAIYQFFQNTQTVHLNKELATCYVLSVLCQRDSYGTELIQSLETEHPDYRLSDTVLQIVLRFLEEEMLIQGYWEKVIGRGRPRRMYYILPDAMPQAKKLAKFWQDYIDRSIHSSKP